MKKNEMKKYANQRGMSVSEYEKWLDRQLENFNFDSDEIPMDVAQHIADAYGLAQAEPEFFLDGEV